MSTRTGAGLVLMHYFLFVGVVRSAPLSLKDAADGALTLVEKILKDLPLVHAATVDTEGLTFDPPSSTSNLQMMALSLDIPSSPVLKPLSQHFTLDMCLGRMLAGAQLYQGLLGDLSARVGESRLSDLHADLRDLQTQIHKMMASVHASAAVRQSPGPDLASRLHGNYDVQVATHLTLTQLRSHCHDLIRSLRAVGRYAVSPAHS